MMTLSLTLYSTILFNIDSIDSGWTDVARNQADNTDYILQRAYSRLSTIESDELMYKDIGSQFFEFNSVVDQISPLFPKDTVIFPRFLVAGEFDSKFSLVFAVNQTLELNKNFGCKAANMLNATTCLVNQNIANQKQIQMDDLITITFPFYQFEMHLYVIGFYDENDYSIIDNPSFIIDINAFWAESKTGLIDLNNTTTRLYVSLSENIQNDLYHLLDKENTVIKLQDQGTVILNTLGIDNWRILYPMKNIYYQMNEVIIAINFLNLFLTIGNSLFIAILLYNYLATSTTKRIKEFGIYRTVGAHRSHLFFEVFFQGCLLGVFSTIVGLLFGYIMTKWLIITGFNLIFKSTLALSLSYTPKISSLFTILQIGVGLPIIISIFPALRVIRWNTVDMLTPEVSLEGFRNNSSSDSQSNSNSAGKLLSVGLGCILFGIILIGYIRYFLSILPEILLKTNQAYILNVLVGIFCLFLTCFIAFVVIMSPLFSRIIIPIIVRKKSKFREIIHLGLQKHRRNNHMISVLVIFIFSLIIIQLSIIQTIEVQMYSKYKIDLGSDMALANPNHPGISLKKFHQDLFLQIEGIEQTSGVIIYSNQQSNYYVDSDSAADDKSQPDFKVQVKDMLGQEFDALNLYGIQPNFLTTIFSDTIRMVQGNVEECFSRLFVADKNCILISSTLANQLNLEVNDVLFLSFLRDLKEMTFTVNIIGIYDMVPGAYQSQQFLELNQQFGIIISQDSFLKGFDLPRDENAPISKILFKLGEKYHWEDIYSEIAFLMGSEFNSYVWQGFEKEIADEHLIFTYIKLVLYVLFSVVLIFALGGFLATAYAIFLERQTEFLIYRSLGLSLKDLNRLLFLELWILLSSYFLVGLTVGYSSSLVYADIIALFFNSNANILVFPPFGYFILIYITATFSLFLLFNRIFNPKTQSAVYSNKRRWI
jgi:ABC-type lipoprotein release transport system permease subunit